jgi:hypothetical protein
MFFVYSCIIIRFVSAPVRHGAIKLSTLNSLSVTLPLSTRVGEICAGTSLIYVRISYFIARSFSLTVNDRKRIPFLFSSRENGHSTPNTTPSGGLLQLNGFLCVP